MSAGSEAAGPFCASSDAEIAATLERLGRAAGSEAEIAGLRALVARLLDERHRLAAELERRIDADHHEMLASYVALGIRELSYEQACLLPTAQLQALFDADDWASYGHDAALEEAVEQSAGYGRALREVLDLLGQQPLTATAGRQA